MLDLDNGNLNEEAETGPNVLGSRYRQQDLGTPAVGQTQKRTINIKLISCHSCRIIQTCRTALKAGASPNYKKQESRSVTVEFDLVTPCGKL